MVASVHVTELAIVFALIAVHEVVFVGASWAFARGVGARVTDVAFGALSVRIRRQEPVVRVGLVPVGGHVDVHGRTGHDDGDPRGWMRLGLGARLLSVLGPWFVVLALAAACLGPDRAWSSFESGFSQVLFEPDVTPLVHRFLAMVATEPLSTTFGLVIAKVAAGNLLPVGGATGMLALRGLWRLPRRTPPQQILLVMLVVMSIAAVWIVARFGYAIAYVMFA